jgi:GDP-L-fucose synthase
MQRILVTGSSGFLGSHIKKKSNKFLKKKKFIFVNSKDFNLENLSENKKMLKDIRPDSIIHLAGYSGGILANKKYSADFYRRNLLLVNNIFFAIQDLKLNPKLIITMGGCSYPAKAKSPIVENVMWDGYPQYESSGYSVAKKTCIVASDTFERQYKINSQILIPGNMYGEYDNFSAENSHVIPGLIRRMSENRNKKEFKCWGDGSPVRDFVYAGDVAEIIIKIVLGNFKFRIMNISSGKGIEIKVLVKKIKKLLGYKGKIVWDKTKPNGQLIKVFSIKQMNKLGFKTTTTLDMGLMKTYKWFKKNR